MSKAGWAAIRRAVAEEKAVYLGSEEHKMVVEQKLMVSEMRGALRAAREILSTVELSDDEQDVLTWINGCIKIGVGKDVKPTEDQ